ncbi:universal stress protein [Marinoscillum furvescens]|uniref:Nucleotide-binding universal stress UspA family protein n=1 Tax=Marinoscillum furvescens DSM 4134 TaxID=1122208 RepID=A0A3D9L6S6_MARFU|nr:universal stress protein [Marinoscillum furvescens]REE02059.1 nucleotide-binding universal stress UspA family protein [Marinoscillum furvescens DSM 4134]
MNRILVPYDFSEVAHHALNFASDIAQKLSGTKITVFNVIEQPGPETFKTMGVTNPDPMENLYIKKMIDTVEAKMNDLMSDPTYKSIDLSYKIVLGNPFKELAQEIDTEKIELVVMGTSGASGAEEFFVGSNAERMVRYAKCPVITLNGPASTDGINDIVMASNFQEVPKGFVDKVKALQQVFGAKLRLVKINTPASFTSTRHDRKQMEAFIEEFGIQNCTYESYNYSNEEDGVIAYAEDISADMIAIGTRQRRGIGHFLAGSIAEDVVNHAKRPVWTYGLEEEE